MKSIQTFTRPHWSWNRAARDCGTFLLTTLAAAFLFTPSTATNNTAHVLFDLSTPTGGPFPSNVFTMNDPTQITGLRVDMAMPDCATHPSDCEDLAVIN